jgi:hypothetical protein
MRARRLFRETRALAKREKKQYTTQNTEGSLIFLLSRDRLPLSKKKAAKKKRKDERAPHQNAPVSEMGAASFARCLSLLRGSFR